MQPPPLSPPPPGHAPLNVLMVGPGLDVPGGLSTVQNQLLRAGLAGVQFVHISTFEENHAHPPWLVLAKAYAHVLLTGMVYDVLHVHVDSPDLVPASLWRKLPVIVLGGLWRVPVVLHTHGGRPDLWLATLKPWAQALARFVLGIPRVVVVPVAAHAPPWQVLAPRAQVAVVPRVVAVPASQPIRTAKDVFTVLFMGRIGPRKGEGDLLPAFVAAARLVAAQGGPHLHLILAGDGEVDATRAWVIANKLEHLITLPGWLDADAKARALAQADALVLPSYAETLPLVVLEAMAAALPVVATAVGDVPGLIAQNTEGYVLQPGNQAQLTGALVKLATDVPTRTQMAAAAFNRAKQQYNLSNLAPLLEHIYRTLLTKKPA